MLSWKFCQCFPNSWHEEKDRKSTRLNSSHANISYAVFCLKKKARIFTEEKGLKTHRTSSVIVDESAGRIKYMSYGIVTIVGTGATADETVYIYYMSTAGSGSYQLLCSTQNEQNLGPSSVADFFFKFTAHATLPPLSPALPFAK